MRRTTIAGLLCLGLLLAAPAWAAAHPEGQHKGDSRSEGHDTHQHSEHHRHQLNWAAYPAEFQTFKEQLEQLKAEQKQLFNQFRQQREQIRAAHDKLSEAKRKTLGSDLKECVTKLKETRLEIRKLSEQKRTAWEQFAQHANAKQWDVAKADIQMVIKNKQEMLAKQRQMLDIQKEILKRLKR